MLAEDRGLSKLMRTVEPSSTGRERSLPMYGVPSFAAKEKFAEADEDIETATQQYTTPNSRILRASRLGLLFTAVAISVSTVLWGSWFTEFSVEHVFTPSLKDACPQQAAIPPQKHGALLASLEETFVTRDFKSEAFESLGGAVRIPCVLSVYL